MCGHVGIAGALTSPDEKLMKRLLIQDYFRGPDSTGFASYSNTGVATVSKLASHPIDLFQLKSFDNLLSGFKSKVFLGHNRFATKGKVSTFNAHPYQFDHITCAHNGTLDKSSFDALNKNLGEEFEVDSMAIAAHIAKFGIENTVILLQGAWALVWIDTNEKTLNFLRNDQRPFWVAYSDDLKRVIWASEHPMIRAAIDLGDPLTKTKLWKVPEKNYQFFSTDVDVLYRIVIDDLALGKLDKEKQPDFRVRDKEGKIVAYKGKEVPKTTTFTSNKPAVDPFTGEVSNTQTWSNKYGECKNGMWVPNKASGTTSTTGATHQHTSGEQAGSTTSTTSSLGTDKGNVVHLRGTDFNPLAGYMTEGEFLKIAKYGCSWCQGDVTYGDVGIKVFPEMDAVMCTKCSDLETHNRVYVTPTQFHQVNVK